MATISTVRNILATISNAPHSVSVPQISGISGHNTDTIHSAVTQLVTAGYLKENADLAGSYFTRKPKRDAIRTFIAGGTTLEGITFDAPATAAPTVQQTPAARAYAGILSTLRLAPHATAIDDSEYLDSLVEESIVREHRDQPGKFFVAKSRREMVDAFLDGTMALDALFAEADEMSSHNTGREETVEEAMGEVDFINGMPVPSLTAATDVLFSQLEAIRDSLNAILTANGR
jgi:hypothetical protein